MLIILQDLYYHLHFTDKRRLRVTQLLSAERNSPASWAQHIITGVAIWNTDNPYACLRLIIGRKLGASYLKDTATLGTNK